MIIANFLQQCIDGHIRYWQINENEKIEQSGESVSISELPEAIKQNHFILILPGIDFFATKIKFPKMNLNEMRKAVPFAVEEQLASDVNQLYFAMGEYLKDEGLNIIAVDREFFSKIITAYQSAGIKIDIVLPDFLALPWQPETWSVWFDQEQSLAMVRTDKQLGFTIEQQNLLSLLQLSLQDEKQPRPQKIIFYQTPTEFSTDVIQSLQIPVETRHGAHPFDIVELNDPPINLLQEKFRPRYRAVGMRRQWQYAGIAFAILLAVVWLGRIAEYFYFKVQTKHLEQQIAQQYQRIFPGMPLPENPQIRVNQLLQNIQRQATGNDFLNLLSKTGQVLRTNEGVELQALRFQNNILTIDITVKNLESLSKFSRNLSQQNLNVTQNQVNTGKQMVTAEINIKR